MYKAIHIVVGDIDIPNINKVWMRSLESILNKDDTYEIVRIPFIVGEHPAITSDKERFRILSEVPNVLYSDWDVEWISRPEENVKAAIGRLPHIQTETDYSVMTNGEDTDYYRKLLDIYNKGGYLPVGGSYNKAIRKTVVDKIDNKHYIHHWSTFKESKEYKYDVVKHVSKNTFKEGLR